MRARIYDDAAQVTLHDFQSHGQRGRVDCGDMHSHRTLRLHPSHAWVVAADTFAGFVFAGGSAGFTRVAGICLLDIQVKG
jgi:hypothetical protein